ncbi:hypothetical protein B0H17DRAFT_1132505 [Mycena rosella]|uniref:Uncharacterized protein n=1 Tax=Mycena rosella TaxID=1033263 RepID=A0AAD7GKI7_MYCRO|nr:hypothetical protein B0H17DRAFT_1132505 [Mycena rosella]
MSLFLSALLGTRLATNHIHTELWWLSDFVFAWHLLHKETPRFELNDVDKFYDVWDNANTLKKVFLTSIKHHVRGATSSDHIIILLFGHGDSNEAEATFGRVECGKRKGSTVWLTRTEVEKALGSTKAHISVISTACFAGMWASKRWAFFSAAQRSYSISLPASGSDREWGSCFWAAMPELAANAHGQACSPLPRGIVSERPRALSATAPSLPGYHLGPFHISEAIATTSAALYNTCIEDVAIQEVEPEKGFSFVPTVDMRNTQWDGWHSIVGIESTINIAEPSSPTTGSHSPVQTVEDDDDDSSWSGNSAFEGAVGEVDNEELVRLLHRWETTTRPLNLRIAARNSLFTCVHHCLNGTASPTETATLWRQFKRCAAADQLAPKVADQVGISLAPPCELYREVNDLPDYRKENFMSIRWGEIAPRDICRLQQPYKKAGQWLFRCWAESRREVDVLRSILHEFGGGMDDNGDGVVAGGGVGNTVAGELVSGVDVIYALPKTEAKSPYAQPSTSTMSPIRMRSCRPEFARFGFRGAAEDKQIQTSASLEALQSKS